MRRSIICSVAISFLLIGPDARINASASQTAIDVDAIPELRLVEELRIGSASDPNIGFSRIGGVSVDREGQVYVFEGQDAQIRVYGTTGQRVHNIGRRGSGPGEFAQSAHFGVKGDTVWAVAALPPRGNISLFSRKDGTLISSSRAEGVTVQGRGTGSLLLMPTEMRADGSFISGGYAVLQMRGAPPTGAGSGDTLRVPRILFNASGIPTDTVAWQLVPPARTRPPIQYVPAGNNGRQSVPVPLSDDEISMLFVDGRFIIQRPSPTSAAPATLRVVREGVRGETIYARSYRYRPVRYSAEVLDDLAAASLRSRPMIIVDGVIQQQAGDTSASVRSAVRQAMRFPDFQPPVQATFIGQDASIWLRREEARSPTIRWDLLDPQGNPRGRINVPNRLRLAWSSGDIVWAVQPDADDVPWLVKYRISR